MPRFYLQKLVRDKLRQDYTALGQKAEYKELSKTEHLQALKQKLIEELNELDPTNPESVVDESVDVLQGIEDLWSIHGLFTKDIEEKKREKFAKKGGFAGGTYVEVLELEDGDEWVDYYRKEPKRFPERLHVPTEELDIPDIQTGLYEHYKGNRYEVLGVGLETETLEPYVLYKTTDQSPAHYWVRPYDMFIETIEIDGKSQPRFTYEGEAHA